MDYHNKKEKASCQNNERCFCNNASAPSRNNDMGNIAHECNTATKLEDEVDADLNYLLNRLKILLHQEEKREGILTFETLRISKGIMGQVERIQIIKTPKLENLLRINAKFWNMANWLVRMRYFSRLKPDRLDISEQRRKLRDTFLEKAKKQSSAASPYPSPYFFSSQATIEAEVQERLEKRIEYYNKPSAKQNYGTDAQLMNYDEIWNLLKFTRLYQLMPSHTAQQTLKTLISNWRGFFKAKKKWRKNPSKFIGGRMPYPPGYQLKKTGRYTAIFTNQQCKIRDGFLYFPTIREKKPILNTLEEKQVWNKKQTQGYNSLDEEERYIYELITYEERGKMIKDTDKEVVRYFPPLKVSPKMTRLGTLKAVRIVPKGNKFICEIVYEKPIEVDPNLRIKNILGIDIGLTNLLSTINNIGLHPVLIRGGTVVSVNNYFNKRISELRSEMDTATDEATRAHYIERIQKVSLRCYNKIYDYFHKATRYIVDYCKVNGIGKIIVGYNEQWKVGRRVSKRFRKNFYPIPFDRLLDMNQYKAKLVGIEYIEIEESYTSQTCSFCGVVDKTSRVKRGLYVCKHCKDSKAINADVSAAIDIVKKIEPHAFDGVPRDRLLLAPKTIYLPAWSRKCVTTV